jgi:hypothetical protein
LHFHSNYLVIINLTEGQFDILINIKYNLKTNLVSTCEEHSSEWAMPAHEASPDDQTPHSAMALGSSQWHLRP